MYKLGWFDGGQWVAHDYPATFRLPESEQESQRLVAGVPGGNPLVFGALVEVLEPPFYLLYVLHTPGGEGESGRYQSPLIGVVELRAFLGEFAQFLSGDARFDLWGYSPAENATVVWDRHNLVFAYGPLGRFEHVLRTQGFAPGQPVIPVPHEHHYRPELDAQAALVLGAFEWVYSPLREEDEQ